MMGGTQGVWKTASLVHKVHKVCLGFGFVRLVRVVRLGCLVPLAREVCLACEAGRRESVQGFQVEVMLFQPCRPMEYECRVVSNLIRVFEFVCDGVTSR